MHKQAGISSPSSAASERGLFGSSAALLFSSLLCSALECTCLFVYLLAPLSLLLLLLVGEICLARSRTRRAWYYGVSGMVFSGPVSFSFFPPPPPSGVPNVHFSLVGRGGISERRFFVMSLNAHRNNCCARCFLLTFLVPTLTGDISLQDEQTRCLFFFFLRFF